MTILRRLAPPSAGMIATADGTVAGRRGTLDYTGGAFVEKLVLA